MYKVFIVDDHPAVVEGIRTLLHHEKNIEWTGHALTAKNCFDFIAKNEIDLLFLDINLPDGNGTDLCKKIKESYPAVTILALSNLNEAAYINKMLENGASGFVLKNADKAELLEAIEAVMNGQTYLSFDASVTLKKSKTVAAASPELSSREKEVLQLIAEGYTNPEIAERLFLSPWTIDSHRKSMMAKLKTKNTAMLIRYAIENGLL
mgnify:CR=1 FL=1